jgi:hypothetical protein
MFRIICFVIFLKLSCLLSFLILSTVSFFEIVSKCCGISEGFLGEDANKTNACQSQVCVADRRLTVNMKMKVTKKKERSFQAIHLKNKVLATKYRFHH